jgi:hypothetical protein
MATVCRGWAGSGRFLHLIYARRLHLLARSRMVVRRPSHIRWHRLLPGNSSVAVYALRTGGHMITELKSIIEGVYILDEWNIDEKIFRPPAVEGRFVILNGNIMTVLIEITQESKKTYNTLYGGIFLNARVIYL